MYRITRFLGMVFKTRVQVTKQNLRLRRACGPWLRTTTPLAPTTSSSAPLSGRRSMAGSPLKVACHSPVPSITTWLSSTALLYL